MSDCHGCKWLDEYMCYGKGHGYCCMVVRSKSYSKGDGYNGSDKIRTPQKGRCELYELGDYKTRRRQLRFEREDAQEGAEE